MTSAWLFIHGILSITTAVANKKQDGGGFMVAAGILLGVLELVLGIYSVVHPAVIAINLGILIGLYFIISFPIGGGARCPVDIGFVPTVAERRQEGF